MNTTPPRPQRTAHRLSRWLAWARVWLIFAFRWTPGQGLVWIELLGEERLRAYVKQFAAW